MPKSKREKVVHLSKTAKKGKAQKEKIINELNECFQVFSRVFVFSVQNMRNDSLKEVRKDFGGSRFFMGKNKVMAYAIGQQAATAGKGKSNLQLLAKYVSGNCGLLFTNSERDEVKKYFDDFSADNYARSGFVADRSFSIPAGPLPTTEYPFSMEPQLRKLGLPTSLKNGVIELQAKVDVCREGETLSPDQCKILQLWHQQIAQFKINLHCMYDRNDGTLQTFDGGKIIEGDATAADDNEDDDGDMDQEEEETKRAPKKKAAAKKKAVAAPSTSSSAPVNTEFKFDPKLFSFSFGATNTDASSSSTKTSTDSAFASTTSSAPTGGSAASRVTRSRAKKA